MKIQLFLLQISVNIWREWHSGNRDIPSLSNTIATTTAVMDADPKALGKICASDILGQRSFHPEDKHLIATPTPRQFIPY